MVLLFLTNRKYKAFREHYSKSHSWCGNYIRKYLVFENPIHTLSFLSCIYLISIFPPLSSPFYAFVNYPPLC